jgi:tRNA uridine 5-carboxymethylaminomethyl modification enzyme
MRFPDRERHQIYLEPEGLDVDEIYVNGFSMSLPRDIQLDLVHALPGLGDAVMLRPAYAIEYDFVQPTELRSTLETHRVVGSSSPARSMALPATKKPPDKESLRA